jgi:AraC family transcriptional regulator
MAFVDKEERFCATPLSPLALRLNNLASGILEVPADTSTMISIHVGRSSEVMCRKGGHHRGLIVHGDIDVLPPGLLTAWDIKEKCETFSLKVPPSLLNLAAMEMDIDSARVEIVKRFQMRDRQIEHIGWALKAEMEAGYPSGTLFLESLGTALATHLLRRHSSRSLPVTEIKGGLSSLKLRLVITYIEDHIDRNLSLAEIAEVACMSVSHLKVAFRQSIGMPVYQYVIRRRVERAMQLLIDGKLSISHIALATGFSHQSHMARHMRRLLGVTPAEIRRNDF